MPPANAANPVLTDLVPRVAAKDVDRGRRDSVIVPNAERAGVAARWRVLGGSEVIWESQKGQRMSRRRSVRAGGRWKERRKELGFVFVLMVEDDDGGWQSSVC